MRLYAFLLWFSGFLITAGLYLGAAGCSSTNNAGLSALRSASLMDARQSLETSGASPQASPLQSQTPGVWDVTLRAYDQGNVLLESKGTGSPFEEALRGAIENARSQKVSPDTMKRARFYMSAVDADGKKIAWVEYRGLALEVVGDDLVAVRVLDKKLILKKTGDAKAYLLRAMDPVHHGFFKKYDARADKAEKRLRTIFTASSLWTLMKLNDLEADPELEKLIPLVARFLLSMQVEEGPQRGAFYYSYYLKDGTREPSFIVGTASKTIFTLLDLYRRTQELRYLEAAKLAGDWLLTRQRADGTVSSSIRLIEGVWVEGDRFSTLYHGQVLSALSRLAVVTHDEKYRAGARKLATLIMTRAREQDYFLRDDFRLSSDPIPTSWGILSLFDYYRAVSDPAAKDVFLKLTDRLIRLQHRDTKDLLNHGRFEGTRASSGNGWINEVFSELYLRGKQENWDAEAVARIKESALFVTRWLVQNTYSEENTFFLRNPQRALGGLIRNFEEEAVRTDAVCHGVNGYINLLDEWPDEKLLEFPEGGDA